MAHTPNEHGEEHKDVDPSGDINSEKSRNIHVIDPPASVIVGSEWNSNDTANAKPRAIGKVDEKAEVQIPATVDLKRSEEEERSSTRESLDGPKPDRTPPPQQMLHRWGFFGWLLGKLFFSRVLLPKEDVERVREAAKLGTVVYVMRIRSTINFLFWNYAFMAHGLPLARFANGLRRYFWQPIRLIFRRLFGKAQDPIATLKELTQNNQSSAIFLRSHAIFLNPSDFEGRYLDTLIELQKKAERPIVIVPLTVLWGKKNVRDVPRFGVLDRLLGNQDEPRALRRAWQIIRHAGRSLAVVAKPLLLDEFLAQNKEENDQTQILENEILERLEGERRVRVGPRHLHFLQMRRQILELPSVRAMIQQQASERGKSYESVRKGAYKTLKVMQAQMCSRGLTRLKNIVDFIWRRTYEGFQIDEKGLEEIREIGKNGPLIFVPTHRSHVDYLVLSDLLVTRGLLPPHIAAGINLSFFPMGWIFRTAGAFFLKRRFQGDALYSLLLREYVASILKEGHYVEVFIEGGRSRTGKVLHPKLGLLSVIADLAAAKDIPSTYIVPVSIGYERLIELKSVTRELTGGHKRPESVAGMIRAARIMRSNRGYGYVNLQFGRPIEVSEFLEKRDFDENQDSPEIRRRAVRSLGYHALTRSGEVSALTPSTLVASAVLAPGTRGVPRSLLEQTVQLFAVVAKSSGARFVTSLWKDENEAMDEATLERAILLLTKDEALSVRGSGNEERIYISEDDARIRLEYYKNTVIQHLLGPAIISIVLRAIQCRNTNQAAIKVDNLRDATLFVISLFRLHFVQHAGMKPKAIFDTWFEQMKSLELIRVNAEEEIIVENQCVAALDLLSGLTEGTIEAYGACAKAMLILKGSSRHRKDLEREVLDRLHRWHLTGNVRRFESCQVPLVKVVIDWLCEEGILLQSTDNGEVKVSLAKAHADGKALEALVERTESLLIER